MCVFAYLVYKPNRLRADGNVGRGHSGGLPSLPKFSQCTLLRRAVYAGVRKSFGLFDYA